MAEPQPPSNSGATVAGEPVKLDFSRDMSYGDYLHLDEILGAQHRAPGRTTRCSSSSSTRSTSCG